MMVATGLHSSQQYGSLMRGGGDVCNIMRFIVNLFVEPYMNKMKDLRN